MYSCMLSHFQELHQQTSMVTPYSKIWLPKAKETRIRKAGPQAGKGRVAKFQRHLHSCLYLEFSCCPGGASSSTLRAPDDLRESFELWPQAKLQDVAAEFQQLRDATTFPAEAGDFKLFTEDTSWNPTGVYHKDWEDSNCLWPLYMSMLGPEHSEVHKWNSLSCGRKRRKSLWNLWSSRGKGTALKQTSISFLPWL